MSSAILWPMSEPDPAARDKTFFACLLFLLLTLGAGWLASPAFVFYALGAPEPGTFKRYTGTIWVEESRAGSRRGNTSNKYFLQTSSGEHQFHCGYRSMRKDCGHEVWLWRPRWDETFTIGFHWYWGVDYVEYPERYHGRVAPLLPAQVEALRKYRAGEALDAAPIFLLLLVLTTHLAIRWRSEGRTSSNV